MKALSTKHPLKIYKASAGSGKTFTLAVEYIKLLIMNPLEYMNTLAVTFTNKATAEMKNRILSQLYGLSKGLASSNDYFDKIKEEPLIAKYDDDTIRQRAGMALQNIVHDYSRFRIETIDSFFQSVLRDLAHELKLSANLRVDLNDNEVLNKAVEDIIYGLDSESDLFKWIFSFIREKIEEEKNWIVKDEISTFGKNIFNESFLENRKKLEDTLADSQALSNYRGKMKSISNTSAENIQNAAKKFMDICGNYGLTMNDFVKKSKGIFPFMEALSEGNVKAWGAIPQKTLNGEMEWIKNGSSELCNQFTNLLSTIYTNLRMKISADESSRHITNLGLLNDIDRTVRQLNSDANRFLLSDTSHFLHEMIGESDVPFLYEKIGNKFTHIMIDEFQDTSRLQWLNFLPLLCNALATDSTCLIVGDVKQSIYRWRNSDWSILNNIEKTPEVRNKVESIPLSTNYRSGERIINFNNLFFIKLIEILNMNYQENHNGSPFSDLKSAYNDVHQKYSTKNKDKGYVRFQQIEKDNYETDTLESLLNSVQELKAKGVKERQIAIILRAKKHIPMICNYFAAHDSSIKMMSDEAFQLKSSPAVRIIIHALRLIVNPSDTLSKKSLATYYKQIDDPNAYSYIYTSTNEQLDDILPKAFTNQMAVLSLMSLTEVTEQIHKIFDLNRIEGQSAYLFCLYDQILQYMSDNPSDIKSFLTAWDEGIGKKTIPNDAVDGIRLMTIHKSKGLEFHTVLMPFCDWDYRGTDTLWITPEKEDFNDLQLLPVKYKKELIHSIYAKDYDQELLRIWVDNVNLLYVGFTRAENNLFIWTKNMTDDKKGDGVSTVKVMKRCMSPGLTDKGNESDEIMVTMMDEQGTLVQKTIQDVALLFSKNETENYMEYGELVSNQHQQSKSSRDDKQQEENILKIAPQSIKCDFVYHEHEACFLQSNESKRFIAGEDEEQNNQYINEGLLFHAILERISSTEDLPRVISRFDSEGWFHSSDYRQSVERELQNAFNNTKAAEWFKPDWQTFNECSILYTDKKGKCHTKRPDRVITNGQETIVIDYKTGRQSEEHVKQVEEYMTLLQQMGYPCITGYVWYIRRNDIVPCRMKKQEN